MLQAYTLMTAPAVEPVSLSEVKNFVKQDGTDDDGLITSLISTARRMCEEFTKRAFITQTWKLTIDSFTEREFPVPEGFSVGPTPETFGSVSTIQLSRQPIQSISNIKSYDLANTVSTVASTVYTLDVANGRVVLNSGQTWPSGLRTNAAGEVTFVAGYGSSADVPEPIRQAIMQTAAAMYTSRGCFDLPDGAKALLAPYMLPAAFGFA